MWLPGSLPDGSLHRFVLRQHLGFQRHPHSDMALLFEQRERFAIDQASIF
jgi:hypothetical protein